MKEGSGYVTAYILENHNKKIKEINNCRIGEKHEDGKILKGTDGVSQRGRRENYP